MFLPVRFSRMSPVPLCTWWGRTDGRTAPPPAWTPPAAAGTWGGGSPPAAVGHSGSILRAPGPLHWQGGDGSARVQFPRRRTSSRAGEAGGCLKPSGWDAGGHAPVLLSGHRGRGDPRQNAAPKRSGAPPQLHTHPPAASFMQAVPKPGSARRAANNRDVSASPGASLLQKGTRVGQRLRGGQSTRGPCAHLKKVN